MNGSVNNNDDPLNNSSSVSVRDGNSIVIVGIGCRFPGSSNSPLEYWNNLQSTDKDLISSTPSDRWNSKYFTHPNKDRFGKITTDRCGFIDNIFEFDYDYFGISKKEAESMDPQQKVLLEVASQALLDSSLSYQGSSMGVYIGIGQAEQLELSTSDQESINAYSVTGSALSIAANRLSYSFDLRGPSISVDTACSSSCTAIHLAKEAIRNKEFLLNPSVMIQFSRLGVLSPDGRCKSFCDVADGYVRSEGAGVIILTTLSRALANKCHIYAILRGSAINSDGHLSPSLTMPSGQSQQSVFEHACIDASIDSNQVYYAEAHATGTKVGDPIEANAIGKVFARKQERDKRSKNTDCHHDNHHHDNHHHDIDSITSSSSSYSLDSSSPALSPFNPTSALPYSCLPTPSPCHLRLGSVKTHVGHLETASFMAGLLKCLLMLKYKTLLPNKYIPNEENGTRKDEANSWDYNKSIEWDKYDMRVITKREQFPNSDKCLMMVSSFGFGGSNGCCIIEGIENYDDSIKSIMRETILTKKEAGMYQGYQNSTEKDLELLYKKDFNANGNSHHSKVSETILPSPPYLYLLSAPTSTALDALINESINQQSNSSNSIFDPYQVSYTLANRPINRNLSFALSAQLSTCVFSPPKKVVDVYSSTGLIWVFSGQGPQHPGMGRSLYSRYSVFRQSIDEMDDIYRRVSGESLVKDVGLFGSIIGDVKSVYLLQYTLPALIFLQTALCDLMFSFNIRPTAVCGHSFGEMAAAYAAGACNKQQLISTAYHRARLLTKIDGAGVMMAVGCSAQFIEEWLQAELKIGGGVWIAAYNGPNSITIGGLKESIDHIAVKCSSSNIFHRVLNISNAFHTPLMRPCKDEAIAIFSSTLKGSQVPQLPYYSTVTRDWKYDLFDADYTWQAIEGSVHFDSAVESCLNKYGKDVLFMEMSAHPVLSSYIKETGGVNIIQTLHRNIDEYENIFKSLISLVSLGYPLSLSSVLPSVPILSTFFPFPFHRTRVYCHKEELAHKLSREVPTYFPLAGKPFASINETYQTKVNTSLYPWTVDHVVEGATVFPAAAYIEMCAEVSKQEQIYLTNITIGRAMIVPTDKETYKIVRTVLQDDINADNNYSNTQIRNENKRLIKIYSKSDQWDSQSWTLHMSATAFTSASTISLDYNNNQLPLWCKGMPDRCKSLYYQKSMYDRFNSVGLNYGPLFQALHSIQTGDGEAFGCIHLDRIKQDEFSSLFFLHPALLDSIFHVLLGTIRYLHVPFVPTSISKIKWLKPINFTNNHLDVYAQSQLVDGILQGDIVISDSSNVVVGEIEGMICTPLGQLSMSKTIQPSFALQWQSYAVPNTFIPIHSSQWNHVPINSTQQEELLNQATFYHVSKFLEENSTSSNPIQPDHSWPIHRQRYWNWLISLPKPTAFDIKEWTEIVQSITTKATSTDLSLTNINGDMLQLYRQELLAVERVGPNLCPLLSDPYSVQRLLFSDNLMSDIYSQAITFKPYISIMTNMVLSYALSHPSRVIHILELGAGTGALTNSILSVLQVERDNNRWNGSIKYWFSDVSQKFLNDAKLKFAQYSFIEYTLLSIDDIVTNSSSVPPGSNVTSIPPLSLDLILAFDVLHVSSNLCSTLISLQSLLVPNGLLMLIELTRPWIWCQLFFGLFQGWWGMKDERSTCWLTKSKWKETLDHTGYTDIQVLSDKTDQLNTEQEEFCHSIITCHAPIKRHVPSSSITDKRYQYIFDCSDPGHDIEYLLSQAQQLVDSKDLIDFYLITTRSQSIQVYNDQINSNQNIDYLAPPHATQIGFTRVLANEVASSTTVIMIDCDTENETERSVYQLLIKSLIENGSKEREFVIRGSQIFIPRFVVWKEILIQPLPTKQIKEISYNKDEQNNEVSDAVLPPFRLEIDTVGQLNTLRYHLTDSFNLPSLSSSSSLLSSSWLSHSPSLLPYGDTDVVVSVYASALNFKDLMLSLGMLLNPLQLSSFHLSMEKQQALGLEFSGVICAVGSKVKGFKVGDDVFGIGKYCIANQVVTNYQLIAIKPSHLSYIEAASMPIVYTTSLAGLSRAHVDSNDRVLVHSAAGGIGQATIQLCKTLGATVIATVGSNDKREYLHNMYGISDFADSHSCTSWSNDVLSLTNGEGVDVIMNSLKGDAIVTGLKLLKVGGRFIEIGKVDILQATPIPMNLLLNDISILSVQLDVLMAEDISKVHYYLSQVAELAERKQIGPLVDKVFACYHVEEAFRYLMGGKHKGKIIIDLSIKNQQYLFNSNNMIEKSSGRNQETSPFASSSSYSQIFPSLSLFSRHVTCILSGGSGAVGLKLVDFLCREGARYFILLSRRGYKSIRPSEQRHLDRLSMFGVHVTIATADVTDLNELGSAYTLAVSMGYPRLVSIFHLAMVLADDPISRLTNESLDIVIRCKMTGIENLISLFPPSQVQYVCLYSSAASPLGNPSQANYAAANQFLDSYAYYLHQRGYTARVLNLGLVEDVGILAEDYKLKQVLKAKGFAGGLTSDGVCQITKKILQTSSISDSNSFGNHIFNPIIQLLHGAFDWLSICSTYPMLTTRFDHLIDHSNLNNNLDSSDSASIVTLSSLSTTLASLFNVPVDKLDIKESLTRQGLDSLLAVELSSTLKKRYAGLSISQMELLGGMSVFDIWRAAGSKEERKEEE